MRKLIHILGILFGARPATAGDLPIRPDPKLIAGAVLTTDAAKPGYAKLSGIHPAK
jgi:hypothetical protein